MEDHAESAIGRHAGSEISDLRWSAPSAQISALCTSRRSRRSTALVKQIKLIGRHRAPQVGAYVRRSFGPAGSCRATEDLPDDPHVPSVGIPDPPPHWRPGRSFQAMRIAAQDVWVLAPRWSRTIATASRWVSPEPAVNA